MNERNQPMLNKAREFSINAHWGQMYGDRPYIYHLDAVVNLLKPYGENAMVIGYLHDVIEDAEEKKKEELALEIKKEFGPFIYRCVSILTNEPGENRKERKQKTYLKLSGINGEEELALVVCVADRLANIQACNADENKKLLKMYKSENIAFKTAVFRKGLCDDLWDKLYDAIGD